MVQTMYLFYIFLNLFNMYLFNILLHNYHFYF
jgi:hypothetical protein